MKKIPPQNLEPWEKELQKGAHLALAAKQGGARPGAGRKRKDSIKTSLLLTPAARKKLEQLAEETGTLSAAANQLITRK